MDRQDGEKMDTFTQAGYLTASGREVARQLEIKAGLPPQSQWRELEETKFIIRVGAIGCSAFGLNKCSLLMRFMSHTLA